MADQFHSPQLLMVSGIGPKATLDQFGIPVLSDLPGVGQDMWARSQDGIMATRAVCAPLQHAC